MIMIIKTLYQGATHLITRQSSIYHPCKTAVAKTKYC